MSTVHSTPMHRPQNLVPDKAGQSIGRSSQGRHDPNNGTNTGSRGSVMLPNANRFAPALNVLGDVSYRNGRHFWRCRVSAYGWAIGVAITSIKKCMMVNIQSNKVIYNIMN